VPTVLVYSDDPATRDRVRLAVGARPDAALGRIEWLDAADHRAVLAAVDSGAVDVAVLDGEAWPSGGMGIARQLKDELADPPPVVLLTARKDDRWLATWSKADAVTSHPLDPAVLTGHVVRLLRERADRTPMVVPPKGLLGRFRHSS